MKAVGRRIPGWAWVASAATAIGLAAAITVVLMVEPRDLATRIFTGPPRWRGAAEQLRSWVGVAKLGGESGPLPLAELAADRKWDEVSIYPPRVAVSGLGVWGEPDERDASVLEFRAGGETVGVAEIPSFDGEFDVADQGTYPRRGVELRVTMAPRGEHGITWPYVSVVRTP